MKASFVIDGSFITELARSIYADENNIDGAK